ncbi:MAG: IS66 family transposase zinc-finger binding domain-containing protein [Afipia sp.]|nr:IS66 family transposase zinc-finger binding domain-containing protein [Afipia sp.]
MASEKLRLDPLSEDQYQFVFDEIDTGLAAISAELEKAGGKVRRPRAPRPRKSFPAHLERVEIVIELDGAPIRIGEDVSERLDVTPAKFRVIVTRRPKYAYRGHDGVIQAAAPAHIIESGIPTEELLAQIAVSKYADGLPLYRKRVAGADQALKFQGSLCRYRHKMPWTHQA